MSNSYIQGIYKPDNPKKYKGNVNNIIYRSSWELLYLRKLDLDDNVLQYSSEEIIIPYRFLNKVKRYFVDFYVKRIIDDKIVEQIVEIKPYAQTQPPLITEGKRRKTMIQQILTYEMNQAKWEAARVYCSKKNWEFKILTEHELGLKK